MSCGCGCGCETGCGTRPDRVPVWNAAGADRLAYRIGTFATFRRALLQQLDGERELAGWQPSAGDDLGLAMLDAWAYIADILTFYNERYANEHYLRTAQLPESVAGLVGLLGYRPRPAIAATGRLAVIASGPGPLVVPKGLAIASKASPGIASQTFEVDEEARFERPSSVPAPPAGMTDAPPLAGPPPSAPPGTAEVPAQPRLLARGGVLLKGTQTLKTGERLLLVTKTWGSADAPAVVVKVTGTAVEVDAHSRKNTRVLLEGAVGLPSNAASGAYRLLRPTRAGHLTTLPAGAAAVASGTLVLDAPARHLAAGDPLLVEVPGAGVGGSPGSGFDVVRLTDYAEVLWYANALAGTPSVPPAGDVPGIPLQVAKLTVQARSGVSLPSRYGSQAAKVVVQSGWREVGVLLDTAVRALSAVPSSVTLAAPPAAAAGVAVPALVEDGKGGGAEVQAVPVAGTSAVALSGGAASLEPPLRVLWDVIEVSRGATVRGEQLGRGDASAAGQDFALAKSPVTFRADFPGRSGDGYSSTIELVVDGRRWAEVPSLYGRGPSDEVFATWNDEEGKTHVRTGDGVAGRRLPTGAVVTADYRVGAGAAVPPPGALTQLLSTPPNLRSVRNPVPPGGGSDAQPADEIRDLAPRSVLTFGRAISGDDYAACAAAAPGVVRATTVWAFDATEQRPTVSVYVGDDAAAVDAARAALRAQADPNRPLTVLPAVRVPAALKVVLTVDSQYVIGPVIDRARRAVLDELFAPGILALGEPLYRSELERVLTDVPGVLASRQLRFYWIRGGLHISAGARFHPGDGGFFHLLPQLVLLTGEVAP
ncbi:baseplate J/gp47 family protein [Microbacterium sp. BK668]|uniref:baseplate J/gp47 family protein n=1 Tax=Microbacterium sp. BK668 TaxID=2512118 RepID=UPI0010CF2683|nr:baseplate J/gp47 family protein [Microbacterium sp. BK668]TDN90913.1 putative phage baseplate assembly protein [Microbacterium sp. BK668]